jgi:hypothetical protein
MVYRKGMFKEIDDDPDETDSEVEVVKTKKRTSSRKRKSEKVDQNYEEIDKDAETSDFKRDRASKPTEPVKKKRKPGRPRNLLHALTKDGIDFLKLVGIKSDREFLATNTNGLAVSYAGYRKEKGLTVLKGTGAASRISSWKRVIRNAAMADDNAELAGLGFRAFTKKGVDDGETDDDENGDNDRCGVCGDGGDLLICDGCDTSYHLHCVNLSEVPEGDWFCPECIEKDDDKCVVCNDGGVLILCDGCEDSYHIECAGLKEVPEGDWFCPKCVK